MWRRRLSRSPHFEFAAALCGLRGAVSALCVSQCFSLIAAGAKDGAVVVWDLHRLVCVRRLDCFGGQPVVALAFDAASGDLHVATSHAAHVFDVNLRRVLSQPLTGGDPRASGIVYHRSHWTLGADVDAVNSIIRPIVSMSGNQSF